MSSEQMQNQPTQGQQGRQGQNEQKQEQQPQGQQHAAAGTPDVDGLADKKPEELTPEELRLMADTMPGEGPGD